MKKLVCLSIVILSVSFSTAAFGLPTVYFDSDGDTLQDSNIGPIAMGSTFLLDIYINGIGENEGGLIAMGVEVFYDPDQIAYKSFTFDTIWNFTNDYYDSGLFGQIGGTTDPVFDDPILLGTVEFECLSVGLSYIGIRDFRPDIPSFYANVASDGTVFDDIINFRSAEVMQAAAPVPEPSTIVLMGLGLVGLAGYGRKRMKQ